MNYDDWKLATPDETNLCVDCDSYTIRAAAIHYALVNNPEATDEELEEAVQEYRTQCSLCYDCAKIQYYEDND